MVVGLGVDLFDVARMRAECARRGNDLPSRIFSPAELAESQRSRDPVAQLAIRFAVKEALVKALAATGPPGVCWRDIDVRGTGGDYEVSLDGRLKALATARGVTRVLLCTALAAGVAVASVVLEARA